MNAPFRAGEWRETFPLGERGPESNGSKDLFADNRTESEVIAGLAKSWFARKAEERDRELKLPEMMNLPEIRNRGKETTQAPAPSNADMFNIPLIRIDALRRPQPTFVPLQEWEGYVVDITNSHVIANLTDLTHDDVRPDEHAEIPLEEFSDDDRNKLAIGRVFRWAIGYQRLPTGTKMRVSQMIVRELPQWTRRELKEAKEEATELFDFLNRDLRWLIAGIVEAHRKFAQARGVRLEIGTVGGTAPPPRLDVYLVRRALDNLVLNAIQSAPAGGYVKFDAVQDGVMFRLNVSGTGAGVSDAVRDHQLELARDIARAHGGDVRLVPNAQGATFELKLPLRAF